MGMHCGARQTLGKRGVGRWRVGVAAWFGAALLALSMACAPTLPRPYMEARAAAQRAYGAGRYDEAARHYRQAAEQASRERDRDEMLYLEAAAKQRAGRTREAREAYEALEKLSPQGPRAARSAYEIAQLELEHGNAERGYEMLAGVMTRYPDSGVARRAMQRYVRHLDDERGAEAGLAYLRNNLAWFKANGLGEQAAYGIADHLETTGKTAQARDAFVQCASDYPYPRGALFDDSLFRASQLDEKLGDPRAAIARLDRMLAEREPSTFSGSYERPRFSQAQWRKALLYRDAMHDRAAARREFRRMYDEFTTSLLRDDALWAEAKLAAEDGDGASACSVMELLAQHLPDSRYVPCKRLVCPNAGGAEAPDKCRRYIARDVESQADEEPKP